MESLEIPSPSFCRDKRVLATGHTGFKDTWSLDWLNRLGAITVGLSYSGHPKKILGNVDPQLSFNIDTDFRSDDWQENISDFQPQIFLLLAAQSPVYTGLINSKDTFKTNVIGSSYILDVMNTISIIVAIVIFTSDKMYRVVREVELDFCINNIESNHRA